MVILKDLRVIIRTSYTGANKTNDITIKKDEGKFESQEK